ncbi:MAG: carbon-nitrogen hydrolase family protein [Phycisphaerales bacterium]
MARLVKISTLGPQPPADHPGAGQAAVDRMIAHWQTQFDQVLPDRPDLIVVPECCDRFPAHSMDERKEYYRYRKTAIRDYFAGVARGHECHVAYPAIWEMPDGAWCNTAQLLDRRGRVVGIYQKNHLVVTEISEGGLRCGRDAPVLSCDFGTVGFAICFDLNFEPIRRKYMENRPDIILFPSMYHGGLMQAYWAYRCQAHFVSAVAGLPSRILSPVGHVIAETTNYFNYVTATVNLDCKVAHLDFNEDKLRSMKIKYGPEAEVFDPGFLGSVLISSRGSEPTAADLIHEFGIETLDDYFKRSLQARCDAPNGETV